MPETSYETSYGKGLDSMVLGAIVLGMKRINKAQQRREEAWRKQQKWEQFKARLAEAEERRKKGKA